jgi:2-polyprenyl-3-methyl-5-hydroxy-6-metoxy-1,4-benzoquinol methylase
LNSVPALTSDATNTPRTECCEHVACPICAGSSRHWATKRDGQDSYAIVLCSACGYAFVDPRPSMEFLAQYYGTFGHGGMQDRVSLQSVVDAETRDPNSTLDARRMVATIAAMTHGRSSLSKRFLDVGAGYGFFSREAVAAKFEVVAINPAAAERHLARAVSGIEPLATSFEELTLAPASVSVVLMSQVLEHALDVNGWVAKAWGLLEREGVLAIALPNFGSLQRMILQHDEPYICPPAHLNYFSPGSLSALLVRTGFTVERIEHVSRLPRRTILNRVPKAAAALSTPLWFMTNQLLKAVDLARLGSIINVYARKGRV